MELQVLAELISHLETCNIEYMLSGSMAMSMYAEPRFTRDFDVVALINPEHIDRLEKLWGNKYYYALYGIREAVKQKTMFNIIHLETMYKIDIIVRTNHIFEIEKFKRRKQIDFMNMQIWVISPEDLILSKLNWIQVLESEMQKKDIKNLLGIDNLDKTYMRHWIKTLHLNTYDLVF